MIRVQVNGEQRDVREGTITSLLEELGLKPQLIVVEHNREILERARFADTTLQSGDTVELVHFVGGG